MAKPVRTSTQRRRPVVETSADGAPSIPNKKSNKVRSKRKQKKALKPMYVVSYSDGGDDEANEAKRELYAPFRREFPDTAVRSSPKQKPKHKKDATASDHNRSHKNKGSKHSSLLCKHRNGVVSSHARMSFAGEVLEGDRHGDNYFASKQGKTSSSAHPRQLGLPLMPTESSSSETISILSDTVFCVGQNSADANAATAAAAATASPEEIQAFSAILDHMMKEGGAEDAKKKKNNNNNKKKKDKKKKKKKNTPFAMFRGKALVDTPPTHQDVPQDHDRQPQQQPQKQKGFNYRKYTSNSTIDPSSFAKYLSSDEDDSLDESGVFDETITTDKNYKKKEDFRMSDRCDSDSLSIGLADDRYASTFEQTTVLGDTTFEQTVLEGAATYEQTYVEDKAKRAEKINDDDNETRDWYVPDGTTIGGTYTNANNTLGGSTAYNNPPRLNLPSIDFDESLLQYHTTTFEGTEATYDDETDRVFSCDDSTENSDSESDESSNSGSYTDYTRNGGTSLFSESTYSTVASGDISSERNTSSTKNNKKNNKPDRLLPFQRKRPERNSSSTRDNDCNENVNTGNNNRMQKKKNRTKKQNSQTCGKNTPEYGDESIKSNTVFALPPFQKNGKYTNTPPASDAASPVNSTMRKKGLPPLPPTSTTALDPSSEQVSLNTSSKNQKIKKPLASATNNNNWDMMTPTTKFLVSAAKATSESMRSAARSIFFSDDEDEHIVFSDFESYSDDDCTDGGETCRESLLSEEPTILVVSTTKNPGSTVDSASPSKLDTHQTPHVPKEEFEIVMGEGVAAMGGSSETRKETSKNCNTVKKTKMPEYADCDEEPEFKPSEKSANAIEMKIADTTGGRKVSTTNNISNKDVVISVPEYADCDQEPDARDDTTGQEKSSVISIPPIQKVETSDTDPGLLPSCGFFSSMADLTAKTETGSKIESENKIAEVFEYIGGIFSPNVKNDFSVSSTTKNLPAVGVGDGATDSSYFEVDEIRKSTKEERNITEKVAEGNSAVRDEAPESPIHAEIEWVLSKNDSEEADGKNRGKHATNNSSRGLRSIFSRRKNKQGKKSKASAMT